MTRSKTRFKRIFSGPFWILTTVFFIFGPMGFCQEKTKPESIPPSKRTRFWIEPFTGIEFVWIPAGCFQMGNAVSDATMHQHEKPVHRVCLDGFYMSRFEVTNAQFQKLDPDHHSESLEFYSMDGSDQPVVNVSWNEAKAFAAWLTKKSRSKSIFRLPTEAEWEYACRAGKSGQVYWASNETPCDYANVADRLLIFEAIKTHSCTDGFPGTSPVGSFPSNAFGLYDMIGNVWEWCEDVYGKDAYQNHEKDNPVYERLEIGVDLRVIRGGSWMSDGESARCGKRKNNPPHSKHNVSGFRLVRIPRE